MQNEGKMFSQEGVCVDLEQQGLLRRRDRIVIAWGFLWVVWEPLRMRLPYYPLAPTARDCEQEKEGEREG